MTFFSYGLSFVCLGFFAYGVELGFFQLMNKVKWYPKEICYKQRWTGSINYVSIQQQDLSRNVWPISNVPCLFNKTAQNGCSGAVSQHNQDSEYYPYSSWTGHEIIHFEKKDIDCDGHSYYELTVPLSARMMKFHSTLHVLGEKYSKLIKGSESLANLT